MRLLKSALVITILIPFVFGIGCSDKSSNPSDEVPADLVGSWLFLVETVNGVPTPPENIAYFNQLAATGHSVTFNASGALTMLEYDDGLNPVCIVEGAFSVSDDTLRMTLTEIDGAPLTPPAECMPATFDVTTDYLIIKAVDNDLQPALTLIEIYEKM